MEALRRLREQVSKQQQAVRKQFYGNSENVATDKEEAEDDQKLEKLYGTTRSAKHFQRNIVRAMDGYVSLGSKQIDIGHRLSEDAMKFGTNAGCSNIENLSKAAICYAKTRALIEKEHSDLLKVLSTQIAAPLREMVVGAPLEDARQLAKKYDKIRHEVESQVIEVSKRQQKVKEGSGNVDIQISKLETAESKLQELKSNMTILCKKAIAAMTDVEANQKKLTLGLLHEMIKAEQGYHQRVVTILKQFETEMASENRKRDAPSPNPNLENHMPPPPSYEEVIDMSDTQTEISTESIEYFLAEVVESYQAETDAEMNLSLGDYVVVRKISSNGWAEGECKGKAGWFPSEYIEKRERVLASKIARVF